MREMGNTQQTQPAEEPATVVVDDDGPRDNKGKKLRPCCVCPQEKLLRDKCIVSQGEENCTELIEAHKECMRKLGFKV